MIILKKKPASSIGARPDLRTAEEKTKDYRHEEIASASPFEWREYAESDWPKYPIFNQEQDGTCVAQTTAKELGIANQREEKLFTFNSSADLYSRRSNKPGQGMSGPEADDLTIKNGMTLETLVPTYGTVGSNDQVKRTPTTEAIGSIFAPNRWIYLPFNIDEIAKVINSGIPAKIFLRWNVSEWDRDIPKLDPSAVNLTGSHSTAFILATLYNGKKHLLTDDSWGVNRGKRGQRLVPEEWIDPRNGRIFFSSYFIDKKNLFSKNEGMAKPQYAWIKNLTVGTRGIDVIMLQIALATISDGKGGYLFPAIIQAPTGYFGGMTRQGVGDFQKIFGLPVTYVFDSGTRKVANDMFK